ncbi:MAG: hypothetical protein AAFY29_11155 [Pseudomonadota bacterium]
MKKMIASAGTAFLVASTSLAMAGGLSEDDRRTTVISHKNGTSPVLTITGDRGTGIFIDQGNKQARGIRIDSGNASISLSPSYVAAGVPGSALGFSKERAAVVFSISGAKLGGSAARFVAFDAQTQSIIWLDADGNPMP